MGPRPFSRGNVGASVDLPASGPASMGPRPFSRGNQVGRCTVAVIRLASMGPRPFSRGNVTQVQGDQDHGDRFNGATAFQPWKSGTGLPPGGQGAPGFNGATAFQPWKFEVPCVLIAPRNASMGPRPFSRGNGCRTWPCLTNRWRLQWGHGLSAVEISTMPRRRTAGATGFNGATAFQPWKCSHA